MSTRLFFGSFVTLFLGGLIYILFRTTTLNMFTWFKHLGLDNMVINLRLLTFDFGQLLPKWVLYSLADGLWIFSFINLILVFWDYEISVINIIWIVFIPLISILSEFGQLIKIVPGTFDSIDLLFYISGTLIPFIIYKNEIKLITK